MCDLKQHLAWWRLDIGAQAFVYAEILGVIAVPTVLSSSDVN